jgi:L-asparagine transporter-like permease
MPGFPLLNWLALAGLGMVTASTWFVPGMRVTLLAGVPWLAVVSLAFWLWRRRLRAKHHS